jgi:hypothetical protein
MNDRRRMLSASIAALRHHLARRTVHSLFTAALATFAGACGSDEGDAGSGGGGVADPCPEARGTYTLMEEYNDPGGGRCPPATLTDREGFQITIESDPEAEGGIAVTSSIGTCIGAFTGCQLRATCEDADDWHSWVAELTLDMSAKAVSGTDEHRSTQTSNGTVCKYHFDLAGTRD